MNPMIGSTSGRIALQPVNLGVGGTTQGGDLSGVQVQKGIVGK
jgi:hypothetical protein